MPQACLYFLLSLPGSAFVPHGLKLWRQQSSNGASQGCGSFALGDRSTLPTSLPFPVVMFRNSKLGTGASQIRSLHYFRSCVPPTILNPVPYTLRSVYFACILLALSLVQAWPESTALCLTFMTIPLWTLPFTHSVFSLTKLGEKWLETEGKLASMICTLFTK